MRIAALLRRCLVPGLAFLIASVAYADEPTFEGKTFAEWVEALRTQSDSRVQVARALATFERRINGFDDPPRMLPKDAARHTPTIVAALSDPRASVRCDLVHVLGEIGAKAAVPALIKALADPDRDVRHVAAGALGKVGPAALPAVAALKLGLSSPDAVLREECAGALGKLGPKAGPKVAPALRPLLKDPVPAVRGAALGSLATFRDPTAWPHLVAVARNPKAGPNLRAEAVWGLHHYGAKARPVLGEVLKQARPHLVEVRSAVTGLVRIGGAASVKVLRVALEDPRHLIWSEAASGLGRLGRLSLPALPRLIEILLDEKRSGVGRGVVALAIGGGAVDEAEMFPGLGAAAAKTAVPALLAVLDRYEPEDDLGSDLHPRAAVALGRFGRSAKAALPTLDRLAARKAREAEERPLIEQARAASTAIRKALQAKAPKPKPAPARGR